jgi:hypothetical protein
MVVCPTFRPICRVSECLPPTNWFLIQIWIFSLYFLEKQMAHFWSSTSSFPNVYLSKMDAWTFILFKSQANTLSLYSLTLSPSNIPILSSKLINLDPTERYSLCTVFHVDQLLTYWATFSNINYWTWLSSHYYQIM